MGGGLYRATEWTSASTRGRVTTAAVLGFSCHVERCVNVICENRIGARRSDIDGKR